MVNTIKIFNRLGHCDVRSMVRFDTSTSSSINKVAHTQETFPATPIRLALVNYSQRLLSPFLRIIIGTDLSQSSGIVSDSHTERHVLWSMPTEGPPSCRLFSTAGNGSSMAWQKVIVILTNGLALPGQVRLPSGDLPKTTVLCKKSHDRINWHSCIWSHFFCAYFTNLVFHNSMSSCE